jgi:subtilisin-like proprotein convertase family protein
VGAVAWAQYCVTPNLAIPDGTGPGVASDLVITDSFILTDVDVRIVAGHTWVGDLVFTLAKVLGPGSPIGPITVIERPGVPSSTFGCSIDNISTTLRANANESVNAVCNPTPPAIDAGPYHPAPDNTSVFSGVDINGTWRLHVRDFVGGDSGTLVMWCLTPGPIAVELTHFSIE